jgi:hypothetical protein
MEAPLNVIVPIVSPFYLLTLKASSSSTEPHQQSRKKFSCSSVGAFAFTLYVAQYAFQLASGSGMLLLQPEKNDTVKTIMEKIIAFILL